VNFAPISWDNFFAFFMRVTVAAHAPAQRGVIAIGVVRIVRLPDSRVRDPPDRFVYAVTHVKRIVFGILAWSAIAHADAPAQLTLKPGALFVQLDLELNVAKNAVAKPFSIAPDASYGVTKDLTLSLIDSTFGTTGFRGGTGDGFCVTGSKNGCAHLYNNVGGEVLYSLAEGDAPIAAVLGLYSLNLDQSFVDLKVGLKTKFTAGALALLFNPSIYFGLNDRAAMTPNVDQLYLPVGLTYKISQPLTVGVGSGIKGPANDFTKFGKAWAVPLGVNAVVTINPAIAVGAAFTFGKLVGAPALSDATPSQTGEDFRAIHVWLNYTQL
jgi:hypothetical protein